MARLTLVQVTLLSLLCLQRVPSGYAEDCAPRSSCTDPQSGSVPPTYRNCFCDELCQLFDDCCSDSAADNIGYDLPFTRAELQGLYECMDMPRDGRPASDPIYVINRCPQSYNVATIRRGCERPSDDDPLSLLPLSDRRSGLVFRNVFCAICHQMYTSGHQQGRGPLRYWQQEAICQPQELAGSDATQDDDSSGDVAGDTPTSDFEFVASREGLMEVSTERPRTLRGSLETKNCTVSYRAPQTDVPVPRVCKRHIATCAAPWWPSNAEGCSGPTDYVYTGNQQDGKVYRNKQCAMCNKEVETDLRCTWPPATSDGLQQGSSGTESQSITDNEEWMDGSGSGMELTSDYAHFPEMWSPPSIRILLDMNSGYVRTSGGGQEGPGEKLQVCANGVYDVYNGKCRDLFCPDGLVLNEEGQCTESVAVSVNTHGEANGPPSEKIPDKIRTHSTEGVDLDCPLVELEQDEYTGLENGSIYVEHLNAILDRGDFIISSNSTVAVCSDLFNSTGSNDPSYIKVNLHAKLVENYLSLGGQLLSLFSLVVMFVVYIALKPLRNLPGKCLLSLALALFLAQLLFLFLRMPEPATWPCWLLATATHYFFLAAFFWMNTMSFDIWRTFQWLSHTSRHTCCRFTLYSLYAWIMPLTLVAVALLSDLDYVPLPEYLRPHYAQSFCWVNNKWGLLIFFAAPIAILLLVNSIFFTLTVVNICRTSRATKVVTKGQRMSKKSHLVLYVKLSAVMGLTWVFGYLANSSAEHSQIMWYLFVVFSSLQGLIICIGFVCNRRVVRLLRNGTQQKGNASITTGSSAYSGATSKG